MLTAANVVPSVVQNNTQTNREIMPEIAFMSKGELRKTIESMALEQRKLRDKVDKYLDESLYFKARCIELNAEMERLTTTEDNISYLRKAI